MFPSPIHMRARDGVMTAAPWRGWIWSKLKFCTQKLCNFWTTEKQYGMVWQLVHKLVLSYWLKCVLSAWQDSSKKKKKYKYTLFYASKVCVKFVRCSLQRARKLLHDFVVIHRWNKKRLSAIKKNAFAGTMASLLSIPFCFRLFKETHNTHFD